MPMSRHNVLGLTLALLLVGCGGGGGGGGAPAAPAPPPQGAPVSQTLAVLAATQSPNPGGIIFIQADPREVVNISFTWTSDCTDGAFFSDTVITKAQTTIGAAWFQMPTTANRTCQILVTGTSPGVNWTGSVIVTSRSSFATDWPSFHGDAANTGRPSLFDLGPTPGTLGQVWKVVGGNVSTVAPALTSDGGAGRVVLGDLDGIVRGFDALTGGLSWATSLGDQLIGNPVIGDGNAIVATAFGAVKALDLATGVELWSTNVGNQLEAVPAYAYGILAVGSINGTVHGLATGSTIASSLDRILWSTELSGRIIGSLTIFDGVEGGSPGLSDLNNAIVYAATDQGFLYALRLSDGTILKQEQLGSRIVTAPVVFDMGADPAVAVATEQGDIWIFSAKPPFGPLTSVNPVFRTNSPVTSAPVFHDGNLYFFLRDNRAISFDPISETLTFSQFLPAASPDSENLTCVNTPAAAESSTATPYLYLACYELIEGGDVLFGYRTARGLLLILSENGITGEIEELGRYSVGTFQFFGGSFTPGDAVLSPPVVMGGQVYLTSQDGSLYALGPAPTFAYTGGPSIWPQKRGDAGATGYFGDGPGLGLLNEKWSYQMPAAVTASPAIAGDTVWFGDLDGNLVALRAGDGLHRFTWQGFNEIGATPIIMDNNLVFNHGLSGRGDILQIDGDRLSLLGRFTTIFFDRLRQFDTEDQAVVLNRMRFLTSLSAAYDEQTRTLYVPMVNNCGFVNNNFSACDGAHWDDSNPPDLVRTDDLMIGIVDLADPTDVSLTRLDVGHSLNGGELFTTSLAVYRHAGVSYLVAGFDNGFGNGEIMVWDVSTPAAPVELWGGTNITLGQGAVPRGVPAFFENFAVVGTRAGTIAVFDLTAGTVPTADNITVSGSPIENSVAVSYDPLTGEGFFFAPLFTGGLYAQPFSVFGGAFSYGSSLAPWSASTNDFVRSSPGVDLESGVIYIGSDDGNLYRFEHDSGFALAGTFLADGPVAASPLVVGGYLIVVDFTGRITALAP